MQIIGNLKILFLFFILTHERIKEKNCLKREVSIFLIFSHFLSKGLNNMFGQLYIFLQYVGLRTIENVSCIDASSDCTLN